jgi:hypothetical protein
MSGFGKIYRIRGVCRRVFNNATAGNVLVCREVYRRAKNLRNRGLFPFSVQLIALFIDWHDVCSDVICSENLLVQVRLEGSIDTIG